MNTPQKSLIRGGSRAGAGRKAATGDGGAMMRKTVTLDATAIRVLTDFGGGELSEGIRRAARAISSKPSVSVKAHADEAGVMPELKI